VRALLLFIMVGAAAAPAFAQGHGHGPPPVASPHRPANGSTTTTTTTQTTLPPVTEVEAATSDRQQTFGTWLDNADINAPGESWMSLAATYWRSSSLREVDVPSFGASVGVTPRAQLSVTVPYYYVTDPTGATFHGVGATYLTGKFALAPDTRVRVAVSPTLEVLSWTAADLGVHRVNVVLPVSVQSEIGGTRVYGSTGYFSRGSVFGAGAVEYGAGSRATLVATLSDSYSVKSDPVSDAQRIARHRTDASGGVYVAATPGVVLFATVGRTISPVTETSGRLSFTGGMTMNVTGAAQHAPRVP
jgi:hypothetical protein